MKTPSQRNSVNRRRCLLSAGSVRALLVVVFAIGLICNSSDALAQQYPAQISQIPENPEGIQANEFSDFIKSGPDEWSSNNGLTSSIKIMLMLTVLTMAPAVLLMTTCFVRIVVVLGLLRQALGTQQLPPTQVLTSLALFLTLLIMTPVWSEVKKEAIDPYTAENSQMPWQEAWERGVRPIKRFMSHQIDMAKTTDGIWMLWKYLPEEERSKTPQTYNDIPLKVLLPAFMLSELKIAFLIGFQIYLPFLVLDVVVSSVTISMGMLMLPPVIISLPLKIILFVLVDGWHLIVGMLLESFAPYS
jgi:flagellar biosynthesis protein FliP